MTISDSSFTFNKRLRYFMSMRKLNVAQLSNRSKEDNGIILGERLIKKHRSNNAPHPKSETIERYSELLNISKTHLTEDTGKLVRERQNEPCPEYFYKNNMLFGNYEFDSIDFSHTDNSDIEHEERELIKQQVKDMFLEFDIYNAYKLIKFFNLYCKIDPFSWEILKLYNLLNSEGRTELETLVFSHQTSIKKQLENYSLISSFDNLLLADEEIIHEVEEQLKIQSEIDLNTQLNLQLVDYLKKESIENIKKFHEQMKSILTFDKNDYQMLIGYLLLTDTSPFLPSNRQKSIQLFAQMLVDSNEFQQKNDSM